MKALILILIVTFTYTVNLNSQNLISNSDFEGSGGLLDCQNWYDACGREMLFFCDSIVPDTACYAMFYEDAPPGGGNWSIGVTGIGHDPPGHAQTYITGLSGTKIFHLNVWMKWLSGIAQGGAGIYVLSQGITTIKGVATDSTDWVQYSVTDTLTLLQTDSLVVLFSVAAAGPGGGTTLFDLVELTIEDTTTGIIESSNSLKQIQIYPNPFSNQATMVFNHSFETSVSISLYNSMGQLAKKNDDIMDNTIKLERGNLSEGIYFYQISNSEKIIDIGKLIIE